MKFILLTFLINLIVLLTLCSGYRILAVFPLNAKSHFIVFEALMKGLAKRGHQIDVVTQFPLKKPVKNYNEIVNLEGTLENLVNNYTLEFVSVINQDVVEMIGNHYGNRICHFMGLEKMQRIIKNPPKDPPYDLVITEAFGAHCYMGLGYVFKVPVIAISSALEYPWVSNFIGNDDNPAYVPNANHIGSGRMNFWERLRNFYTSIIQIYHFHRITGDVQTELMRKYLSPDIPHIREVEKNVALTFVNSNPVLVGIKPLIPTLKQIGGLHIEMNEETLSPELEKWMNESTHGVVYFSFGSMVLIESMTKKQLTSIYASFGKLAPIRVVIKIVDKSKLPPGLPKNIMTAPWIPQQSILAHPNTKAFITHGGLGGVLEALYFGVPLIGIPLFADQFRNIENSVGKNMSVRVNFNEISEATLDSALNSVLKNPMYKEKAVYYSKIFRDQPISPLNATIYWVEYIIRNGPDALRSPTLEMSYWQLTRLDIYGFILLILILGLVTIISIITLIVKFFTKKTHGTNTKKEKRQ